MDVEVSGLSVSIFRRLSRYCSQLSVFYSKGASPLVKVAGPAFNDNSGGGQFHVGLLKLPTGPLGIDVLTQGYQESHLNEGLIYGGVFIEDSSDGCITLSPL